MNDNQNNQNVNQTEYIDPRTINAEVIGELRKDKIGRPELVMVLFLLFGLVLVGLPLANKLLNDENSTFYKILHPNDVIDPVIIDPNPGEEFQDGSQFQTLDALTNMRSGAIVIKNVKLNKNEINCIIYSYTGEINLDESDYFLQVGTSEDNILASVKLIGSYDNREQTVTLRAKDLAFNNSIGYLGKIVEFSEGDYPNVTIESDESGIGSFTCKLGNRSIEYTFKNSYLIGIKDEDKISIDAEADNTAYINKKKIYDDKAAALGAANASVEEIADGFKFYAKIDYENQTLPDTVKDYNYFAPDEKANIIHYTMQGKGFDCGE